MAALLGRALLRNARRLPWRRSYSNGPEVSMAPPGTSESGGIAGRRFYKRAHMRQADDGKNYVVMLDHWMLKTPLKRPVVVPTPGLAMAIAAEWEYQITGIRPFTMPIMKLSSTVIDRYPAIRDTVVKNLMHYLDTDTIYCRAPDDTPLAARQAELWDPLIDWVESKIGAKPVASSKLLIGSQPKEVSDMFECTLNQLDNWDLSAVDFLASSARSLVIALAIVDGHLDVQDAIKVIRVDEDFQVEEWGLVEGGHDIDVADLKVRITSASVFCRLLKS